ncbi:ATP-binding protein [Streptomyces sp. NPDC059766]|uniref:ATP-binding protein n=1 Tax=Streptomyces sp. NPDC059766 TaxID=3346940 RepID=UPI00366A1E45
MLGYSGALMNARHTTNGTDGTAPLLRLHLFGGFRATRDSGPALAERWPRPGARALVKLLAVVPGHSLHREQAMDICWPDADPQAAAGSLRVALHAARRALEPELAPRAASSYLVADGAMLRLDPAAVWIDADHAESAAETALASGEPVQLERALREFTGELLPEDRYATWAQPRRDRLTRLREETLLALAVAHLERGALPEAVSVAEQVLAAGPAEELAHRVLIDAYTRQGLRRRAVRQYHVCREALDAELGVRPGPETERLHRAALAARPPATSSAPSLPAALRGRAGAPLRGRDDLLRRLLAAEGTPVRLLTGEAGVGKTRLVAEAARRAGASGSAVLWGGGHDAEGHTPYGAFAEALDGWLAGRDAAERARAGTEHPELAAFLPSLGRAGDGVERSPEEERDRLFRGTAALLGELAAAHPVLMVLDDLHAADTGSFQLLSHLARRSADAGTRLRFLVTCREEELPGGDPRRSGLAALLRQGLATREEVARLDREACLAVAADAVARAAESRSAGTPRAADAPDPHDAPDPGGPNGPDTGPDERLRRVWELSLGNPLFAVELARGLAEGDPDAVAPDGVRQVVAERLGRLDRDTRRVVEALSAAGGEAALSELLDVAEHGLRPPVAGADAADALERAISVSLVEERHVVVAGRPEAGLAFRHPVVRLTCYEQLTAVRRRQLHAAFAQAVLRRRPDAVDALASHFARADDPRAAEYLRRAAERAAALYANDTADRYYRELVTRLDADAAQARLAHSQVLGRMGHFTEAAEVLRAALAEFRRRGAHDDTVLAAAQLADTLAKSGATAAAQEVLRAHPPGEATAPGPAARHFLALAMVRGILGRYEEGHASALRALETARRVPGTEGQGLQARSYTQQARNLGLAGRFHEAREAADQALAPAEAYGDPTLLVSVLSTLRENARRAGRLREAVGSGERALTLAERSGDPTATAFERANLAELRLLLAEPGPAGALAEAAVAGAERDDAWCLPYALATLARVRMHTGATAEAEALLGRAGDAAAVPRDRQAGHEVRTARAELALRTGRPGVALAALEGFEEEAPVLVAWAELLAGRAASARRHALAEVSRAGRTGERLAEVEARIALGVALSRLGRADEAQDALERAAELSGRLPYPAGTHRLSAARDLLEGGEVLGGVWPPGVPSPDPGPPGAADTA